VIVVPATPSKRSSRDTAPRKLKWRHHAAAFGIFCAIRLLSWTWRVRLVDQHGVLKEPVEPVLVCLWHNRLALAMRVWTTYGKKLIRSSGLVALISASHDGGVLARTLKFFGVQAVRGSSSRRGAQALLELTSWVEKDYAVAITPDGPRGPCYRISDGILALSQLTGRPILPVSTHVNWKRCLKSWDRFQIPLPFARCEVRVGKPFVVPRELTDYEREQLRQHLEAQMMELTTD
jgi:lysophospholipid acyltransferase (LPLAT)-like uncharacterized protein